MGGSFGKSESESQQTSQQQSTSNQSVWGPQASYLEGLYGAGKQVLEQQGAQFAGQFQSPAFAAWQRMLGGGGSNPALEEQISDAQMRAAEGFNENILPGLTSSAINAGQLGGARGGIAAGMAAREAVRDQGRIATELTGRSFEGEQQRALQALGMTQGLAGLSAQSFAPLLALAQLLGRPTVLTQSQGTGSGQGTSSSESFNISGGLFGG